MVVYLVLAHWCSEFVGSVSNVFVKAFEDETEAGLFALELNEAVEAGKAPDIDIWRDCNPLDWSFSVEPATVKTR